MAQFGVISNQNSSTNPLIANGEFIGVAENVAQYAGLFYAIEASTNCTLALEFSQDGSNWSQIQLLSVVANILKEGLVSVKNKFFRSRVVNITGDQQTFLRLSVIYKQVIPTTVDIDTNGLATSTLQEAQLSNLNILSACVADNKVNVAGSVSVDTTGLATETTQNNILSNVAGLSNYLQTNLSFNPSNSLWTTVDNFPSSFSVSNQISGFSLETTQQEVLNGIVKSSFATLPLGTPEAVSAYADSNPAPVQDTLKRKGWYFNNASAGQKFNYYYYSSANYTTTLGSITGCWCICQNDATDTTSAEIAPIINVYTVGNENVWFKSRQVYSAGANGKMVSGQPYLFYWGTEPDVFPEVKNRIQMSLVSSTGTCLPTETVLTISVGSSSSADTGKVKNLMSYVAWKTATNEYITELEGNVNYLETDVRILEKLNAGLSISNFPATQAISGSVSVSNFPATQPVSVASLPSIEVSNFPATQTISGSVSVSNLPATQPISGSVSVSNLPATQAISGSVSVSNLPATQAISGSVSVSNFPATQPVSIASLPSVEVSNFPATQPVSISGSVLTTNSNVDVPISTINSNIVLSNSNLALIESHTSNLTTCVASGKFQCNVSIASGQKVVIDGGSVGVLGSVATTNENVDFPLSGLNSNIVLGNSNLSVISSNTTTLANCVSSSNVNVRPYVSPNGTNFHHIASDANGQLIVHSLAQDGAGNDITSHLSSPYRGLDVYLLNSLLTVNTQKADAVATTILSGTPITINTGFGSYDANGINSLDVLILSPAGCVSNGGMLTLQVSDNSTEWYSTTQSVFLMQDNQNQKTYFLQINNLNTRYIRLLSDGQLTTLSTIQIKISTKK